MKEVGNGTPEESPQARACPPELGRRLVAFIEGPRAARETEEFLDALFRERVRVRGLRAARRWYWRQALGFALRWRSLRSGRLIRDMGPTIWVLQDITYGLRVLGRQKVLTAVAVASLAIGIGASTSVFSAVDVFLLRPLPFPRSGDLYQVWGTNAERGWSSVRFSLPNFRDLRARSTAMELAATDDGNVNLSTSERADRIMGKRVTANFLGVLGVQPTIGRDFVLDDERSDRGRVAIISDGLWRRRFGADSAIVGTTVRLDGIAYSILGVLPPDFWFEDLRVEILTPMVCTGAEDRGSMHLEVVARVGTGKTKNDAVEELGLLMRQLEREHPAQNSGLNARLVLLRDSVFNENLRMGMGIAMAAVVCVLLIACANAANLLLTHAMGRERELALRGALGAGRARIVRQLLTETMIVAAGGGVFGVALSVLGIHLLRTLVPWWFQGADAIGISGRVLLVAAGISVSTGLLCGLVPAALGGRRGLFDALRDGGRGGTGAGGMRLRKALAVSEVSAAFVLLVSSVLLAQGFARLQSADVGFDKSDVLSFRLSVPAADYEDDTTVNTFYSELREALGAIPGVAAVSAVSLLPLEGNAGEYYALSGEVLEDASRRKIASVRHILPGYFATMDIPVLRGRAFGERDRQGAPSVVVINQELARRHWGSEDPVGHQIWVGRGPREVIGVVASAKYQRADRAADAMLYLPAQQSIWRSLAWVVETREPPETVMQAVRSALQRLDPSLPAYAARALEVVLGEAQGGPASMVKILGVLAVIACVLAVGGVYGVMTHSVSQRTQEFGIRVALGAQGRDVISMVARQGAGMTLTGVLIGAAVALGATRGLARFLFGVSAFDPLTFGGTAATLLLAGLATTRYAARRATKVNVLTALGAE